MTVHERDTPMLRVGLSIILLAGWTVATPVARSADDDPIERVTIKGSVTYEAGDALPPGSREVIELRHLPALPNAPAVANSGSISTARIRQWRSSSPLNASNSS